MFGLDSGRGKESNQIKLSEGASQRRTQEGGGGFESPSRLGEMKLKRFSYPRYFVHSYWFVGIMGVVVCYSLLGDHIKHLFWGRRSDTAFDVLTIAAMAVLLIELGAHLILKKLYFCEYHFFADVVSVGLMPFDLSWIRNAIFERDTSSTKNYALVWYSIYEMLKLVRITKLLRLIWLEKYPSIALYLQDHIGLSEPEASAFLEGKAGMFGEGTERSGFLPGGPAARPVRAKQSKISQQIFNLNNKFLMLLLIFLLVGLPLLDPAIWDDLDPSFRYDPEVISVLGDFSKDEASSLLTNFYDSYKIEVINCTIGQMEILNNSSLAEGLRLEEMRFWRGELQQSNGSWVPASEFISVRYSVQMQALLYIFQTICVAVVFISALLAVNLESKRLITNNLEKIQEKIRLMAQDPGNAAALEVRSSEKSSDFVVIEQTLQNLGYLHVLGFGQAGNSLLSEVLWADEFDIDFISRPAMIFGVFGFCDIRNFTDATEVLEEEVLEFVNTIAFIVHDEVAAHNGGANKNIGDAFLVVWKLIGEDESSVQALTLAPPPAYSVGIAESAATIRPERAAADTENSRTAEKSLLAFLKVICRINTEPSIEAFNKHPKLLKKIPGFRVKLGIGLHAGWAVEGAIGSYYKIDMSYLSPHVDMASKLEGHTKFYGVSLLFTHSLVNLFASPKLLSLCRRLDRVRHEGEADPFDLYTIDLHLEALERYKENFVYSEFPPPHSQPLKLKLVSETHVEFETLTHQIEPDQAEPEWIDLDELDETAEAITLDPRLTKLLGADSPSPVRTKYSRFRELHSKAVDLYIEGKWKKSSEVFAEIERDFPPDPPSKAIADFIKKNGDLLPEWKGFREE